MFQEFMNMEMLTTFTGLTGAVIVIVQFSKSFVKKKFGDSFVRLYAFIIAFLLTFLFGRNGTNAQGIVLTLINSMVVTIASMGGYEVLADPMALGSKKK